MAFDSPNDPFPFDDEDGDDEAYGDDGLPFRPEFEVEDKPRPRHGGSMLMAAMLGLADALGHETPDPGVEIVRPVDNDQDGLDLDFGDLDPL